jgi:serralysin
MSLVTGSVYIDSLVSSSWNSTAGHSVSLTYSFLSAAPTDYAAKDVTGFKAMNAVQVAGVKTALATWSAVANVTFTQVDSGGQIEFGTSSQDDSGAFAYRPDGHGSTLYVFSDNGSKENFDMTAGNYGLSTLIHEIGHTLGFKHPGDYGAGTGTTVGPFLPTDYENRDYSIMSYNDGDGFEWSNLYDATPMLLDIQAMQYLYGANLSYHTGNDTYRFTNNSAAQCIWDAGGADTFDFSQCNQRVLINLREGGFSSTEPAYSNISIAFDVNIEKAIAGSGGSYMFANNNGNILVGGAGTDIIYEGGGNDTISGDGGDTVVFYGDLAEFTLSGNKSLLTVKGDGTDTVSGISTLEFDDRTISLSSFSALQAGTDAKDSFTAVGGSELVTGGAGIDTDKFSGKRADYTIKADGGDFKVTDNVGAGGTDLLSGVERLRFSDGSGVALDIDGAAGQTYRLYQAAFNRKPDAGGVGFWLNELDSGLKLVKMAQFFLDSPESVRTYGALDNTAFVNLMYANVLHRAPDADGLKFYLDGFANGNTRAQVLQGFSESPENQAALIGSITNGVDYIPVA